MLFNLKFDVWRSIWFEISVKSLCYAYLIDFFEGSSPPRPCEEISWYTHYSYLRVSTCMKLVMNVNERTHLWKKFSKFENDWKFSKNENFPLLFSHSFLLLFVGVPCVATRAKARYILVRHWNLANQLNCFRDWRFLTGFIFRWRGENFQLLTKITATYHFLVDLIYL